MPKKPPPRPTADVLREAALAFLARRAVSVVELERLLARRIGTWAQRAARAGIDEDAVATTVTQAREVAVAIVARFRENGLLDDTRFATQRAQRLGRSGKSARAIAADLSVRGIDAAVVQEAVPRNAESELVAALVLARKKRLGAFARASTNVDDAVRRRWLGALARAGYSLSIAQRALRFDREGAEELLAGRDAPGW